MKQQFLPVEVAAEDQGAGRLLRLSELDANIKLISSTNQVELSLTAANPSRLIGRHGQTLDALQTLVGLITDRLTTDRRPILFNINGYRGRCAVSLDRLARRLCQKARQSGKPVSTPPLVLGDRRILHEVFKQEAECESYSKNHEGDHKIIILRMRR